MRSLKFEFGKFDQLGEFVRDYESAREAALANPLDKDADFLWTTRALRLSTFVATTYRQADVGPEEALRLSIEQMKGVRVMRDALQRHLMPKPGDD